MANEPTAVCFNLFLGSKLGEPVTVNGGEPMPAGTADMDKSFISALKSPTVQYISGKFDRFGFLI
jgi:hypothetical protein